ncbi:MAG: hypothetical protein ACREDX_03955 [Aestuariivirga sp.]
MAVPCGTPDKANDGLPTVFGFPEVHFGIFPQENEAPKACAAVCMEKKHAIKNTNPKTFRKNLLSQVFFMIATPFVDELI